jgi:hypothetical protein
MNIIPYKKSNNVITTRKGTPLLEREYQRSRKWNKKFKAQEEEEEEEKKRAQGQ